MKAERLSYDTVTRLPLELLLDDDGETPCDPPDGCIVCDLWPRDDEPRAAYLARLGDLFRLSPDGHGLRARREAS